MAAADQSPHRPHPRGSDVDWQALTAAPATAEAIVRSYQAAFVHAAADGATSIHVDRRRADARQAALRALAQVDDTIRTAVKRIGEVLGNEIHGRMWAAEDSERDSWDYTDELERIPRRARWPSIRQRLEDARESEELLRVVKQVATEFRLGGDDDGFAILTYQIPGYLTHRRHWPPGRIASAEAAIEAEERRYEGEPPEALVRKLNEQERSALDAMREAREAVS